MNHSTIKAQIYMSASWYSTESILFNSCSPGVIGGHNRVKHFYICFNGGNLWKSFQKPTEPKKFQIYWQGDLMAIKKSNVACVHRRDISQYDSGERCGPWASCFFLLLNTLNNNVIHSREKMKRKKILPTYFRMWGNQKQA
jgi:hypothetical protein